MVGHRFVEAAIERGVLATNEMVVVGEEGRRAYDRVHLSSLFDGLGSAALQHHVETLGLDVMTGTAVQRVIVEGTGTATAIAFADREPVQADVIVFAAGVRPRDDLARAAGLVMGERGGVVI